MDARLHQLQAEAEPVKPADLLAILREFHRDKLTLRQRHVAVAKQVSNYDANNTYQYVINREDTHLSWLEAAIAELDGTRRTRCPNPCCRRSARKESFLPLVAQDAQDADGVRRAMAAAPAAASRTRAIATCSG